MLHPFLQAASAPVRVRHQRLQTESPAHLGGTAAAGQLQHLAAARTPTARTGGFTSIMVWIYDHASLQTLVHPTRGP